MDEREFGARIKTMRENMGLSQKELADRLNLDQGKISLIEKGLRKVDVVNELPLLAKALQCSIGDLFNNNNPHKKPVENLLEHFFPGVKFKDVDIKRVEAMLKPLLETYVDVKNKKQAG